METLLCSKHALLHVSTVEVYCAFYLKVELLETFPPGLYVYVNLVTFLLTLILTCSLFF